MVITNRRKQVKSLPVTFLIEGEAASKANSRRLIGPGKIVKSAKALGFSDLFNLQCPYLLEPTKADVIVAIHIAYASRRPDLDESLILDLMQGKLYVNDRQVKQKAVSWGLNRVNPHAMIMVSELPRDVDVFKLIVKAMSEPD